MQQDRADQCSSAEVAADEERQREFKARCLVGNRKHIFKCAIMGHDPKSKRSPPEVKDLFPLVLKGAVHTGTAANLFFRFKSDGSSEVESLYGQTLPQMAAECKKYLKEQAHQKEKAKRVRERLEAKAKWQDCTLERGCKGKAIPPKCELAFRSQSHCCPYD
jgi:hypothetical protein